LEDVSTYYEASYSIPCPRLNGLNLFPENPSVSPNFCTSDKGSAPGERINTIGDFSLD
jgi:hypothetical protein